MATPIPRNQATFTVIDVCAAVRGTQRQAGTRTAFTGATSDSRAIVDGNAFFALRGEHHDGHAHIEDAVKNGAALVVVEHGQPVRARGVAVIEVADTLIAWGALARAHLRRWRDERHGDARVVTITGSAGKTTTKEMCAALLRQRDRGCLATLGNLNNRIGLPATAFTVTRDHRFVVLEAGMSLQGEMAALASIAEPDIAIITCVDLAHTQGVRGGLAGVAAEKGALFAALKENGAAVANADDDGVVSQLSRSSARTTRTFGRSPNADYRLLERVSQRGSGAQWLLERPLSGSSKERFAVVTPLASEVAAIDFLAALAAADLACGEPLPQELVRSVASHLTTPEGRGRIHRLESGALIIDDTYNANPKSMRAALALLSDIAQTERRRPVAILGEMKELGELSSSAHQELGEALRSAGVAFVIGCGGDIAYALERAKSYGISVVAAETSAHASELARRYVEPNDAVLVKASRSVGAEVVTAALLSKERPNGGGGTP